MPCNKTTANLQATVKSRNVVGDWAPTGNNKLNKEIMHS